MTRSDVMTQFGLSVNQASADLSDYIGFAPNSMNYDKSERTYVRQPGLKAQFVQPDASRYLAQLWCLANELVNPEDLWIATRTVFDAVPTSVRGVSPRTLRSIVGAMRRTKAVEVQYDSLSRPEPVWRWMAPHAIAFDGFRWHTRAFYLQDNYFRDFLLSRILDTCGMQPTPSGSTADLDWAEQANLVIGPHPALSDAQR